MAGDIKPPTGLAGGEKLARDAAAALAREEAALKEAGKTVAAAESTAGDAAALRKRLTKAQQRMVDALARGQSPLDAQPGRGASRYFNAEKTIKNLVASGVVSGGVRDASLTDLGREVANLERTAAAAEDIGRRAKAANQRLTKAVYEVQQSGSGGKFDVIGRPGGPGSRGSVVSSHRSREAADAAAAKRKASDEIESLRRQQRISQNEAEKLYKSGARPAPVAGLESAAEAEVAQQGKAVARGRRKGRLKAAKEMTAEQEALMREYLGQGANATKARQALQKAGVLGDTGFIGAIERDRGAPRANETSIDFAARSARQRYGAERTVGSPTWAKQMQELRARPGVKLRLDPGVEQALDEGVTGTKEFAQRVKAIQAENTRAIEAALRKRGRAEVDRVLKGGQRGAAGALPRDPKVLGAAADIFADTGKAAHWQGQFGGEKGDAGDEYRKQQRALGDRANRLATQYRDLQRKAQRDHQQFLKSINAKELHYSPDPGASYPERPRAEQAEQLREAALRRAALGLRRETYEGAAKLSEQQGTRPPSVTDAEWSGLRRARISQADEAAGKRAPYIERASEQHLEAVRRVSQNVGDVKTTEFIDRILQARLSAAVDATEDAEKKKTAAVEEGTRKRAAARRVEVTDANRAAQAPTLRRLTHHLPEIGEPGIHREQGIDRQIYEQTGKQLPRSDVNLFTHRDAQGRILGALEAYAPYPAQEGGEVLKTPQGKTRWQVRTASVAVEDAARRQGIAAGLMRHAIEEGIDVLNPTNETYTKEGAALVNRLVEQEEAKTTAVEEGTKKRGAARAAEARDSLRNFRQHIPARDPVRRESSGLPEGYRIREKVGPRGGRKGFEVLQDGELKQGSLRSYGEAVQAAERLATEAVEAGAKRRAAVRAAEGPLAASVVRDRAAIEADIKRQQQIVDLRQASPAPAKAPERTQAGRQLAAYQRELEEFARAEQAKTQVAEEGARKRVAARQAEARVRVRIPDSVYQDQFPDQLGDRFGVGQDQGTRRKIGRGFTNEFDLDAAQARRVAEELRASANANLQHGVDPGQRQLEHRKRAAADAIEKQIADAERAAAAPPPPPPTPPRPTAAAGDDDAENARTRAAEEGRKKRQRIRAQEGEDIRRQLGDSADDLAAATRRNEADIEAGVRRAQEHARAVAAGRLPPIDSDAARAAAEAERARSVAEAQALARRSTDLVRRTDANAGVPISEGPRFGQYPYAPIGREQEVPDTAPDAAELKRRADYVANAQRVARQSAAADARRNRAIYRQAAQDRRDALRAEEADLKRRQRNQYSSPIGPQPKPPLRPLAGAGGGGRELAAFLEDRQRFAEAIGAVPDDRGSSTQRGRQPTRQRFERETERATKEQAQALAGNTAAATANEAAKAKLAETDARVAASQGGAAAGFNRAAVAAGLSTQALTRHGYLTSEAIEAAKRGELTYKQWGQQISGTAAKFAGWTAVSIPVFAALDGVRRIGEGAIASASGVGKLQRVVNDVNGDRLQAQFRGLSGQFNVPIDEVSDSVGRMGQVFKSQEGAVQGATAALYAFKTGGVDVEVGSKNLIAIANGFKLAGDEILPFFDQINEAQNEFGVTIPDSLAGLAKAAGAFGNAGGSKDYLLSLIGTGKLTTGRTGENIGTAIQRSVGFLSRPTNQEALKSFGIDPTQGIEEVYTQAFKVAEDLSGKELQRLATALSSPQYASYFVPILQNYQKFQDIQQGTSPSASKDSAANELAVIMGQLDEEIKSIGIGLGNLGSNLAEGGFLSGLQLIVGAFDKALDLVNGILGVFNLLPGPIKTAVSAALQLKGLQLVARRVPGLGDAVARGPLAGAAPYLRPTQTRTDAISIRKGLNDQLQARRDELERIDKEALRANSERGLAQSVYTQRTTDVDRRVALGTLDEAEAQQAKLAASAELEASERAVVRSTYRQVAAKEATVAAQLELQAADAAQARGGEAELVRYANDRRLFAPSSSERPTTGEVLRGGPNGLRPDRFSFSAPIAGGALTAEEQRTRFAPARPSYTVYRPPPASGRRRLNVAEMTRAEALAEAARNQQATLRGRISTFGTTLGRYGASVRAVGAAAGATTAVGRGLAGSLRTGGGALKAAALSLGAALGPLDVFLIGAFALYEGINHTAEKAREIDRQVAAADSDPEALRKTAKDLRAQNDETSLAHQGSQVFSYPLDIISTPLKPFGIDYVNTDAKRKGAAEDADARADFLDRERAVGRQKTITQIQASLKERLAAAGGTKGQLEAIDTALTEAVEGYANNLADDGTHKAAKAALAAAVIGWEGQKRDLQARGGALRQAVDSLGTPEDFQAFDAGRTAGIGLRGGRITRKDRRGAALERIQATRKLATGEFTPAQALQAIQEAEASVLEPAEKRLQDLLAVARTPKQVRAAHKEYKATTAGVLGRSEIIKQLQAAQRRRLRLQGDLADAGQEPAPFALPGLGSIGVDAGALLGKEGKRGQSIKSIKDSLKGQNRLIKGFLALLGVSTNNLRGIQQAEDESAAQTKLAAIDQRTELAVSEQTTPEGKSGAAVQGARRHLAFVNRQIQKGIFKVADRIDGQIALNNALQADAEAAESDAMANFEARLGLATSQLAAGGASDYALANRAVSDAQAIYNKVASTKGSDSTEAINALKGVYDAKTALNQLVEDQAKALLDSVFNLRSSRTDNPVKLARIEAQKAKRILSDGNFDTKAERNDAKADRNRTRRDKAGAVADRRIENLNLDEEIGRITTQQEIAGLQRILKIANLGSEKKRQIKQQILRLKHDLEGEGNEFDLNVGNIKLPTAYQVKRFARSGPGGTGHTVVNNSPTINVNGTGNPKEVATQVVNLLGQTLKTSTRAQARAAGRR